MEKRIENLTGCLAIALEQIDKMAKALSENKIVFEWRELNEFLHGTKLHNTLNTEVSHKQ